MDSDSLLVRLTVLLVRPCKKITGGTAGGRRAGKITPGDLLGASDVTTRGPGAGAGAWRKNGRVPDEG
jgi:hypothetical protein